MGARKRWGRCERLSTLTPLLFPFFPLATRRQIKQARDLTRATPRGNEPPGTPLPRPPSPARGPKALGEEQKRKIQGFSFSFFLFFARPANPLRNPGTHGETEALGASRSWFLRTEGGLIWIRTQDSSVVSRWSSGFTQSATPSTIFSAVKYPRHGRNAHPGPAFSEPWPVSGERVPRGTARRSQRQAWHNRASSGSPSRQAQALFEKTGVEPQIRCQPCVLPTAGLGPRSGDRGLPTAGVTGTSSPSPRERRGHTRSPPSRAGRAQPPASRGLAAGFTNRSAQGVSRLRSRASLRRGSPASHRSLALTPRSGFRAWRGLPHSLPGFNAVCRKPTSIQRRQKLCRSYS